MSSPKRTPPWPKPVRASDLTPAMAHRERRDLVSGEVMDEATGISNKVIIDWREFKVAKSRQISTGHLANCIGQESVRHRFAHEALQCLAPKFNHLATI